MAGELYIKKAQLDGTLSINGRECDADDIRSQAGYVYQEDRILETQTVREAVELSASLRLPSKMRQHKRSQVVDDILETLGLSDIENTLIGSVSGGEKKRVALAMEMIVNPSVLMLDEPVSGLDANSAYNVIYQLKQLARDRTIIATIHQPNSSIFQLFDDLVLLDQGRVVYEGPVANVVEYFGVLGYKCPQYVNPADFLF